MDWAAVYEFIAPIGRVIMWACTFALVYVIANTIRLHRKEQRTNDRYAQFTWAQRDVR